MQSLSRLSGDWENYLDRSFSRQFLKGKITTMSPDRDAAAKAFTLLFWMKYLFHLRILANNLRFIEGLCTHLSERLHLWRAEAYRRMGDADPPLAKKPVEHLLKLTKQRKRTPLETPS